MGLKGYNQYTGFPSFEELFWMKVDKNGPNGCWLWTGARRDGYGFIGIHSPKPTTRSAHRVAYELVVGPISAGLVIDHLCRVPACVNPDHLEAVTQRENLLRGRSPSIMTYLTNVCQRGHSMDDAGFAGRGRRCRTCLNARSAAYRARRSAQIVDVADLPTGEATL